MNGGVGFASFVPSNTGLCFVQSAYQDGTIAELNAQTTFTFSECPGLVNSGSDASAAWSGSALAGVLLLLGAGVLVTMRRRTG